MSNDGSTATPLNGRPHTTLSVKVDEDVPAATTNNNIDPILLTINGASVVDDVNGSCVSDDEVGPL